MVTNVNELTFLFLKKNKLHGIKTNISIITYTIMHMTRLYIYKKTKTNINLETW